MWAGGPNCGALTKYLQAHERADKLKIGIVSKDTVWVQP